MLDARITKRFDGSDAPTLDVHIKAGNGVTVLFGSSGAGKTSILRAVAGILSPDEGRITLDDTVFFDSTTKTCLPMQKRKIGYVFQNHALFPHMTAEQNALYAASGDFRKSAAERVRELFALLGIAKTAKRRPHELSGGEQQRVALARALATDPVLMLLDEPLSSVDTATRTRLTEEIADIQQKTDIPFLYVTHSHTEALRLGKTMVVIEGGRVAQQGTPMEIFNAPQTASVARTVGTENIFPGHVLRHQTEEGITAVELDNSGRCVLETSYNGLEVGSIVTLGIHSENILISRERITQTSARNILQGEIRHIFRDMDKAEIVVNCGVDFKTSITPATVRMLNLKVGDQIFLLIKARAIYLLT